MILTNEVALGYFDLNGRGSVVGGGSRSERRRSVTLGGLIGAIDNFMLGVIGWICLCLFIAIDLHEGVL